METKDRTARVPPYIIALFRAGYCDQAEALLEPECKKLVCQTMDVIRRRNPYWVASDEPPLIVRDIDRELDSEIDRLIKRDQ